MDIIVHSTDKTYEHAYWLLFFRTKIFSEAVLAINPWVTMPTFIRAIQLIASEKECES